MFLMPFLKARAAAEARYLAPIAQFFANYGDGDLTDFGDFKQLIQTASIAQDDDKRQHTALALAQLNADVVAFQEVDSFDALKRFLSAYYGKLGEKPYRHVALHEGNDMRGIDVAVAAHDDWPFLHPITRRPHTLLGGQHRQRRGVAGPSSPKPKAKRPNYRASGYSAVIALKLS